ncbi:MAG TPA: Gfo/Idh/MocA family oxidoreductase [bacterium]|nr:Gfo/Idh/MocA family oxidoreductase [bacterium]
MRTEKIFKGAVVGLGFIGAGDDVSGKAIGQSVCNLDGTHAMAMDNNPHINLVAGASRDKGRRDRFSQRFNGVRTYQDWRELIFVEKPDIVSIATNTPYHVEIGITCAESGVKAILCEKPIATKLSDADKLLDACKKNKTILAVNHSRRWHGLWKMCKNEIKSGIIGEIHHACAHWQTGRLGNMGTHIFDVLRMLLDVDPVAVSGTLDSLVYPDCRGQQYRDPGGWGIIAFSNDIRAFIDAPQSAKFPLVISIVGSEGELRIHNNSARVNYWNGDIKEIPFVTDGKTSLDSAMEDIVNCLLYRGIPACTGEDGLMALEIIIGFHVSSIAEGRWINLPICGEERNLEVMIG